MEKIVPSGGELPRGDPIQVFFLRPVVVRPVDEGDQPDRVPAQRMDESAGNFLLSVVVGDCLAEEPAAIRSTERLEGIRVETGAADAGEDGVEQTLRQRGRVTGERERRRRSV